jgi:hypothetical protein
MSPVKRRRAAASVAVCAAVLAVASYGLGPSNATASSHREAPLIAADPTVDNTDVYAFTSPDRPDYVTIIMNYQPFEDPPGGPNFYPFATDAAYLLNVDNDGDATVDFQLKWTFQNIDRRGNDTFLYNKGPVNSIDDPNLLFRQTYKLESRFNGGQWRTRSTNTPVAPSRVGNASMPNYQTLRDQATVQLQGGWKLFAGQADDPFFLDLRVFDLLYGTDLSEVGQDTLSGFNVNTIAVELPKRDLALRGDPGRNPNIGIWGTTERNRVRITGQSQPVTNDRVQVSRLGNPLVNEVVVPAGLKDAFNSISPDKDAGIPAVVNRVKDPEVARLIEAIYKIPRPKTPRNDLVEIYLTGITTKAGGPIQADLNSQLNNMDAKASRFRPSEMLRLNMSTPVTPDPNRLGVLGGDNQGFPNGRRLTDDVVDISLQAVEGAAQTGKLVDALAAGDKVDANQVDFGTTFPFVALPNVDAVGFGTGSTGGTGTTGGTTDPSGVASIDPSADPHAGDNLSASPAADESPASMSSAMPWVTGGTALGAAAFGTWWWMSRRRRLTLTPPDAPSDDSTDNQN